MHKNFHTSKMMDRKKIRELTARLSRLYIYLLLVSMNGHHNIAFKTLKES